MRTLFQVLIFSAITAATAVGFTACNNDNDTDPEWFAVDDRGYTTFDCTILNSVLNTAPYQALDATERDNLLFMREEEKLARDVYLKLNETWNRQVFDNISQSEATHMCAVLNLLNRYNVPDPVGDNGVGVFTNQDLQNLYTTLLAQGSNSLLEALAVGAAIEEIDILDLQTALGETDNQDITYVFENLMAASRNHLRAFVQNYEQQGVTYVPQYLTQAEYDAIINDDMEKGPKGKPWQ
ncbi:MAG: DUF2202 domain-containing protein [Bacteroidetes bacterium]|nr:MAG: DUF2202 domain-containing protein [Bacteroidota bacterium]